MNCRLLWFRMADYLTGVGKISRRLAEALQRYQPRHVLNYGSAGALRPACQGP